jgi:type I restriction enzyme R subunit
LSLQESITDVDSKQLLNVAIENVIFDFTKIKEEELKMLANDLQDVARKTRTELNSNRNQKDSERVSIYEEFRQLLAKHNIEEENAIDLDSMKYESSACKHIYDKIKELNRKNELLKQKFGGDEKYARTYKILETSGKISSNTPLFDVMKEAKNQIDHVVHQN